MLQIIFFIDFPFSWDFNPIVFQQINLDFTNLKDPIAYSVWSSAVDFIDLEQIFEQNHAYHWLWKNGKFVYWCFLMN